ncbi:hypothetical protein B0T22DRAFT_127543 [Podospora appendiculata]|uniref:Uncharacterized protein n=1 Tax=Podospora appendiculata TaxID=314037 RepID=A0AAE0X7T4_9PEZI|nr:hypothetical protein B0T22DRAFT_127543 [Podospora appendiculata]
MGVEKPPTASTSIPNPGPAHHHPPSNIHNQTLDIESQTHNWTDSFPLSETPRSYSPVTIPPPTLAHAVNPPSRSEIKLRKGYALLLAILLLNLAIPFTPLSWILPLGSGTALADALVANLALACACYFHFRIASLDETVLVTVPSFGSSSSGRTVIRNGYVITAEAMRSSGWVWAPEYFWAVAGVETGLLVCMAWYRHQGAAASASAEFEIVRRCVVVAVVGAAWYVGWSATPREDRAWAWRYVREFWFWQVASRVFRGGWVGVMRFGGVRR